MDENFVQQLSTAGLLNVLLTTYSAQGNLEGVKSLVDDHKVDPNIGDYDQRTPLHLASEEGHLDIVKFLVSRGAQVNVADRFGASALRGAVSHNRSSVVQFLKDSGGTMQVASPLSRTMSFITRELAVKKEEQLEEIKTLFKTITQGVSTSSTNVLQIPAAHPSNRLSVKMLGKYLERNGLYYKRHPELKRQMKDLTNDGHEVLLDKFIELMKGPATLLQRAIRGTLVVPNWRQFVKEVTNMFEAVQEDCVDGENANYIPDLAEIDPELYGLSIVTVDGQMLELGDTGEYFTVQGTAKPMLYSLVCDDVSPDEVHAYVGQETNSSGAFSLNEKKKPHNPFTNSGAIVVASMFKKDLNPSKRYKFLTSQLSEYAGGQKIGFNLPVYLSEKHVDRNYAIAHFMQSEHVFPPGSHVDETVDFYFQTCSIEATCSVLSVVGATYANVGLNPLTNKQCMKPETAKRTQQLMYSCGMYDFSGEWACTIGLPAKSGASGVVFVTVPNVLGLCIYSPRLTSHGNSTRAIELCSRLAKHFGWNVFEVLFAPKREKKGQDNSHLSFKTAATMVMQQNAQKMKTMAL